jgi:hypothetical protein
VQIEEATMMLAPHATPVDRIVTPAARDNASAEPHRQPLGSRSPTGPFRKVVNHLPLQRNHRVGPSKVTMYYVTDRLHDGSTVRVLGYQIAPTVSTWLSELGVHSPLVEDLAQAARVGDWAVACAVGEQLSVDVTVVATA